MEEKLRYRCPLCGMIFDEGRLGRSYKIKVFLQEFGGKVAGNIKGRGKAKGFIKYTDVTRSYPKIVSEIKAKAKRLTEGM